MREKMPLILLSVLLLATGVFLLIKFALRIVPPEGGGYYTPPVDTSNRYVREVVEKIDALENAALNLTEYNNIKTEIGLEYTEKLFDETNNTNLLIRLDLAYINTLNNAAQTFFAHSTNPNELSPIHQELKRYYNKPDYQLNVKDMYVASNAFYDFYNKANAVNSAINDDVYDESILSNYLIELDNLSDKGPIKLNPYIANTKNEKKRAIIEKMVLSNTTTLTQDIEGYTGIQEYSESITTHYLSKLNALCEHPIIGNETPVVAACSRLKERLEKHKEIEIRYESIMKTLSNDCETQFQPFTFYITKCKTDTEPPPPVEEQVEDLPVTDGK
ncbi:MAG: hypothetical protein IPM47_12000 [Sphingobacteriales bacterium]|nr:MAG: hypothetical protein IPM47_12000 [Sphingobacteriales bacterium]